jgi:L-gulono-1,4-lactone dehydrogenase
MQPAAQWRNWYGNQSCTARLYRPENLAELRAQVRRAAADGRIRVVGSSMSWSGLVPSEGSLISIASLRTIRAFDAAGPSPTVRVEAGATVAELVRFLGAQGLTLRSPPVFTGMTVGGAVATGTHGTGLSASSLSDDVVAMTLVDGRGELVEVSERDPELLHAAQISLGTLGVLYDVTLRCAPSFNVLVENRYIEREQVLSGVDDLLQSYPFVELYWFPFSDRILCMLMRQIDAPAKPRRGGAGWRDRIEHVLTIAMGDTVLPFIARTKPSLAPRILAVPPHIGAFRAGEGVAPVEEAFHYHRSYPRCLSMSFAVPLADTARAVAAVIDCIEREGSEGRFPVNIAVHARFIGGSAALLSPAYGGPVCDLEVVTARGTPDADRFYRAFTDLMLDIGGARPHWGKHILRPEAIRSRYPAMAAFLRQRERVDPERIFLNRFLEQSVFQLE